MPHSCSSEASHLYRCISEELICGFSQHCLGRIKSDFGEGGSDHPGINAIGKQGGREGGGLARSPLSGASDVRTNSVSDCGSKLNQSIKRLLLHTTAETTGLGGSLPNTRTCVAFPPTSYSLLHHTVNQFSFFNVHKENSRCTVEPWTAVS